MPRFSRPLVAFLAVMLALCVALPAAAQGRRRGGARPESAKPEATAKGASASPKISTHGTQ